jgi:hypothetical protein
MSRRRIKERLCTTKRAINYWRCFRVSGNKSGEIVITVAEEETIVLSTTPITFKANFSYIEPNDEERLKPVGSYFDEDEFYEDGDWYYRDGQRNSTN